MKRIAWILAVLLSHWRRHPMQLATLLIGLISATALWSGVQALNLQARESYDRAAAIAKRAATESRPILDIAIEETGLPRDELARLLDPARLARGEVSGK